MKQYFEAAIDNIYRHGDTDIFPFPIQNRVFYDSKEQVADFLVAAHDDFEGIFSREAPDDLRELSPVGPNGFRTAAQLDPFWNAYLLGEVLSIADSIEGARLGASIVYSYRIDRGTFLQGDTFRRDVGWVQYYTDSRSEADNWSHVLVCDIADCYGRISHHKLENALRLLNVGSVTRDSIMKYLSYTTGTRSSGLPVGGPAARILAELALNNIDRHLHNAGIPFKRYADDFHVFCDSKAAAYKALLSLSEALENDGLVLQRSKTRILSRAEFIAQADLILGQRGSPQSPTQRLMSLSLRYDPYSQNADQNYERLRDELSGIDIVALLNEQLACTQVHIATTKKIVSALNHLAPEAQFGAAASMLNNMHILHPIATNVFIAVAALLDNMEADQQAQICAKIRELYDNSHEVMAIPLHVAFANRIIAKVKSQENEAFLHRCFDRETSVLVRRDIYLIFANWRNFSWLSIRLRRFTGMSDWERRAAVLASFYMSDEGRHWRQHTAPRFTAMEDLVRTWRAGKQSDFELPLS